MMEPSNSTFHENPLFVHKVRKQFGDQMVLDGATLRLQPGSITGLLGRNAAGKTTLIRTAVGLLSPDHGNAYLFGTPAFNAPASIRQRVGYVAQKFDDLAHLRVGDAIELVGSFYDRWDHSLVERFRREWQVPESKRISKLSHGQQQKASILIAIGHRPELLILDEPVASLDPVARHDFIRALLELNVEINQTILFSSHITTDIERVAADIAILHQGIISYHGSLDQLKEQVQCLYLRPDSKVIQQIDRGDNLARHVEGYISCRIDGQRVQVWVRDWDDEKRDQLRDAFGVPVHAEHVGLEDLFMGMTS
ncbi:MAG: ABC transporter ATP-binding protein [Planctomycetota bacterium]